MKCTHLFTALILSLTILSQPTLAHASTSQATESRLSHAKELLGKYYKHSIVKTGESWKELNTQIDEWTRRGMKASSKKITQAVARTIIKESNRYQLDPVFLAAVIQSESSFNPRAEGDAGEIGLMQLMPATAKWIAEKYHLPWKGKKMLYDPVRNIQIGAAYFDFLRGHFDNHSRLYLSAYNMGAKNVERVRKKHLWPKEYASRVMKNYVNFYSQIEDESELN